MIEEFTLGYFNKKNYSITCFNISKGNLCKLNQAVLYTIEKFSLEHLKLNILEGDMKNSARKVESLELSQIRMKKDFERKQKQLGRGQADQRSKLQSLSVKLEYADDYGSKIGSMDAEVRENHVKLSVLQEQLDRVQNSTSDLKTSFSVTCSQILKVEKNFESFRNEVKFKVTISVWNLPGSRISQGLGYLGRLVSWSGWSFVDHPGH